MSPTVLFVPAAGPQIGGGHVMRDLSLATALAARGAQCVFAVGDFGRRVVERFGSERFPILSPEAAGGLEVQAVVLDDFSLDAAEHGRWRRVGLKLVVIDDLADRPVDADLLVDPSLGRAPADYAGKAPAAAGLLLGPAYALLRPAFAALRPPSAPVVCAQVERIFISFGLSDIQGVTARAAARAAAAFPTAGIDVALGPGAASLPALQKLARERRGFTVSVEATDVAGRLARADLAIGAGGSATWERACLGVPTLSVVVADNQRDLARTLDADGRLIACELDDGFDHRFSAALERMRSPEVRAALGAASWAMTDGQGAGRVADAILANV